MPPRIAFVSPSGLGNLGDAAIIDALIGGIRRRLPQADIVGFTLNPEGTRQHGVPAFSCAPSKRGWYSVQHPTSGEFFEGFPPAWRKLESAARYAIKPIIPLRRGVSLASLVVADRRFRQQTTERLRGFDSVVIAGGGQLGGLFGGTFAHPYTVWCWSELAQRVGARFVVLSVGTGTLATRLSRLFVRRALARADYRSFRDERSRELVGDPELTHADPIVPDLAYSLPFSIPETRPPGARRVFGVSPMVYGNPEAWPVSAPHSYERHLAASTSLTVRLARAGHEVVLFATDSPDPEAVAQVLRRAKSELTPREQSLIRVATTHSVAELMRVLSEVDVVVSSRLHGVLLAHVAGRPALAIAHERKVATLMEDMGLSRFCFDIDDFEVELGWARLLELDARYEELSARIRAAVNSCRRRVEEQYDRVFGHEAT